MQNTIKINRIRDSIKIIEERARNGNINAKYLYCCLLFKGNDNIPINREEGTKYLKTIANSNIFYFNKLRKFYSTYINNGYDREAMYNYAIILYDGDDNVEQNKKTAAKYFEMAANLGHNDAAFKYACMLKNGDGIKKNEKKAKKFFMKVAKNRKDIFLMNLAKENLKSIKLSNNQKNVIKIIFHNILNFIFLNTGNF